MILTLKLFIDDVPIKEIEQDISVYPFTEGITTTYVLDHLFSDYHLQPERLIGDYLDRLLNNGVYSLLELRQAVTKIHRGLMFEVWCNGNCRMGRQSLWIHRNRSCEPNPVSCKNCKFRLVIDEGYSNYTVEGSSNYCLKGNNYFPISSDEVLKTNIMLDQHSCEYFKQGSLSGLDVDREDLPALLAEMDEEQREGFEKYCG